MRKIEYSWQIPDNPLFTEIAKDLTDFFGLIRKLSQHGFTETNMETMVFSAFYYDKVKNDLSNDINMFLISRVNRIIELNPQSGKNKEEGE